MFRSSRDTKSEPEASTSCEREGHDRETIITGEESCRRCSSAWKECPSATTLWCRETT